MKGVPLRVEIGPKDIEKEQCVIVRRDTGEKTFVPLAELEETVQELLKALHTNLYESAKKRLEENTYACTTVEEVKANMEKRKGFAKTMWCGNLACELAMKELGRRQQPLHPLQSGEDQRCLSGLWQAGKAYGLLGRCILTLTTTVSGGLYRPPVSFLLPIKRRKAAVLLERPLFCDTKMCLICPQIRFRTRTAAMKMKETHLVIRASFASQVFFLWLDRKVSLPPLRAPATPEFLPDWSKTTQIRNRQAMKMMMVRTSCAVDIGRYFLSNFSKTVPVEETSYIQIYS